MDKRLVITIGYDISLTLPNQQDTYKLFDLLQKAEKVQMYGPTNETSPLTSLRMELMEVNIPQEPAEEEVPVPTEEN